MPASFGGSLSGFPAGVRAENLEMPICTGCRISPPAGVDMTLLPRLSIGRGRSSDARVRISPAGLVMVLLPLSGLGIWSSMCGASIVGKSNRSISPAALVTMRPGGLDIILLPLSALKREPKAASAQGSDENVRHTLIREDRQHNELEGRVKGQWVREARWVALITHLVSLCSSLLRPDTEPAGVVLLLLALASSNVVCDDVVCDFTALGVLAAPSSSPQEL